MKAIRPIALVLYLAVTAAALVGCGSTRSGSAGSPSATNSAATSAAPTSGAASSPAVSSAATKSSSGGPPCNEASFVQFTEAGRALAGDTLNGFGCSADGKWAYLDLTVPGSGPLVQVVGSQDGDWVADSGVAVCPTHLVPADIYSKACTNNTNP